MIVPSVCTYHYLHFVEDLRLVANNRFNEAYVSRAAANASPISFSSISRLDVIIVWD